MRLITPTHIKIPSLSRSALALTAAVCPIFLFAADGTWTVDNLGNWSTATNWSSNPTVPGTVAGDVIGLTNNIGSNRTVTIDTTSRTVGILNIGDSNNTHSFTLAASGGATLTFNNNSAGAQINTAGSVTDNISAPIILADGLTITTSAGTLNITGGVTTAGNTITFEGAGTTSFTGTANFITGTGGIIKNGSGTLILGGAGTTPAHNYSGATVINGGIVMTQNNLSANSNYTLNNAMFSDYFQTTTIFTGGLGTGAKGIQIYGASGFGGGNGNSNWRIGNTSGGVITWGTLNENGNVNSTGFFNPTTLKLRSIADNNGPVTFGQVTLENRIDLNSGARTIDVLLGSGNIGNSRATINAGIQDTGGTGSLTLTGGGMLVINGTNSTWGGSTNVNAGILFLGGNNENNIGGGSARNITIASGAGVQFNALSNAVLNRIVETTDEIIVMTGTTSNSLDFSSSTGATLPNAFLGNYATNGAKAEVSGTITPGSNGYKLGGLGSAGLLGIVGTNKLTGTSGLTVGGTGGSGIRVELAGANNFTGDTVITSGAKLTLGNNLALQNSALNAGAAGGNLAFSTGIVTAKTTGSARTDSPTFGGLIGSRSLTSVFSSVAGNNEQVLQSYQMLGFTLNTGTGTSHTYTGAIADFARGTTLTKSGAGTQTLGGGNSHTGVTTIDDGVLKLGHANALGRGGSAGSSTGATTVNSGGTLDLNGVTGVVEPIVLNGMGFGGNGALVNNSVTPASVTPGLASLRITSGGTYGGTAPTVTLSGGGGSGALATATLGLTNATITSITSGGTGWVVGDQFTVAGGGGSGAVYQVTTVNSGAITGWTLVHAGSGYTSSPTGITRLTGNSGGANTFVFNNANFSVSGLTITNFGSGYTGTPSVTFGSGAATADAQVSSVTLASDSSIGGSGDLSISAAIGESGGARVLSKVGAGTLSLTGANTYTGGTTLNSGTLAFANGSLGTSGSITFSGNSTLQWHGSNTQDVSARIAAIGSGITATLDTNGNDVAFASALSGPGSLAKTGSGNLTLSGASTYSGGTSVTGGTLTAGHVNAFGTGAVTLSTGATINLAGLAVPNPITNNGGTITGASGSATISQSGGSLSGTLGGIITASGTVSGTPTLTGTLKGTASFSGAVTIQGIHAPGNSPGIQTFAAGVTYDSASTLEFEFINDTLATRGTDYDGVNVTGGNLTIVAGASLKLIAGSVDYTAADWNALRSFTVVSYTGGGTSTGNFSLDTSTAGSFGAEGGWSVLNNGADIVLTWTPVPEPSTYAALAGLAALGLAWKRRRQAPAKH